MSASAATFAASLPTDPMERAWRFISPECATIGRDWKAPIRWSASESALTYIEREFGVTLGAMLDAVVFFTATETTVIWDNGVCRVEADGYRAGPAGDH